MKRYIDFAVATFAALSVLVFLCVGLFLTRDIVTAQPIIDQISATIDTANTALTADTTLEAATNNLKLYGWTVRESAGTAAVATVILRHGVLSGSDCTAGAVIDFVELEANGDDRQTYAPLGLAVASGVCADVVAGTVDVNIYTLNK